MKKLLVLASLGLLAFSFSCGDSGVGGDKAANTETAAGMSNAVMSAVGTDNLFAGISSASVNESYSDTINCFVDGTISATVDVSNADSGTATFKYNACGQPVCDGHVFMNGTLTENFSVSDTTVDMDIKGIIEFIDNTVYLPVLFAGTNCGIDIAMSLDYNELMSVDGDDLEAYINDLITGTICGYEWQDVVEVSETDYCTTVNL